MSERPLLYGCDWLQTNGPDPDKCQRSIPESAGSPVGVFIPGWSG